MEMILHPPLAAVAGTGVQELLNTQIYPLGDVGPFLGAGIYLIYYCGDFEAYAALARQNRSNCFAHPIFAGGAISPGDHKSVFGLDLIPPPALYARLMEHAESIESARNLNLDDFFCRFLLLDEALVGRSSLELLEHFSPVWNHVVDGFDMPNPGKKGYSGARSRWDTIHPGRWWAENSSPYADSIEDIFNQIARHVNLMARKCSASVIEK